MIFAYKNSRLYAENIAVSDIAKQVGTPFYCYSKQQLTGNFLEFKNAFSGIDATICYALKSNSNHNIISLLQKLGSGADTVSEGEVRAALKAGISPDKIVFSGVGKTKREMEFGLRSNIGQFNVESIEEIELLNEVAGKLGVKAPVSIRVNPDVDAKTHDKISTGRKSDKFGIAWEDVFLVFDKAKHLKNIDIQGITTHIGSQITSLEPYKAAFHKVAELFKTLREMGYNLARLDLGGGIGIKYKDENPIKISDYADIIKEVIKPLNVKLFLEPGRRISGNAGILVSEVQYIKKTIERDFAIIDAGMNDLARPAVYGAYHEIISVDEGLEQHNIYDVVGPVCESSDIFGKERRLKELRSGDLLAILCAGAYGASMSSVYNLRPLIPEIMVDGDKVEIIRKRQTYEELLG
ncbi:MAG TPA: diaminopimelate decarboxylase [Alphaproteobacteria bacterium]|nr:diaminopimelate decarboxylase [Alphaproteobacteria bacterium]